MNASLLVSAVRTAILALSIAVPSAISSAQQASQGALVVRDAAVMKGPVKMPANPEQPDPFIKGGAEFALAFFKESCKGGGNAAFSPCSVQAAFAMVSEGAAGQTRKELWDVLRFPQDEKALRNGFKELEGRFKQAAAAGQLEISIANSLWPQKGYSLLPDYVNTVKDSYGASVSPLDFASDPEKAREAINSWVSVQTRGRIKDLLAKGLLNKDSRLVLANALYFKGEWADKFMKMASKEEPFLLGSGESKPATMMKRTASYPYFETQELQALEMPYKGGGISMLVVLPKERNGLAKLEARLSAQDYAEICAGLAGQSKRVKLSLPRFKVESGTDLIEGLKALGVKQAFIPMKADFSGIDGGRGSLFIGAAVHKAYVEVDEDGTEAAAASAVSMALGSAMRRDEPVEFKADHPFLFIIKDSAGEILFLGRVADPGK